MNPRQQYQTANVEAARLILSDVARHGGEGAALVTWARVIIERAEAQPTDSECGPLFAA
jgi:hypothetical protein